MQRPLRDAFVETLGDAHPLAEFDADELESAIEAWLARGHRAWPGLGLDDLAFVRYLASRVELAGLGSVLEVGALKLEDLYLAFGCARQDEHAVAVFRAQFFDDAHRALRGAGTASDSADEAVQRVLTHAVVGGATQRPGIAGYSGRGSLRRWVRSVAVRTAAHATARERPSSDEGLRDLVENADPELEHLKGHYRAPFRRAFAEALASLDARDRNLLRHYFVGRVTIDALGELHGVHRSTAARWVASAKERVRTRTLEGLAHALQLDERDAGSIARLVQSQIELTLERVLAQKT